MSLLDLHVDITKHITIMGESFEFKTLSTKQFLSLFNGSTSGDTLAQRVAEILANNIIGEDLSPDDVMETFSFEELSTIGVALIEGFSEVDAAGKPS